MNNKYFFTIALLSQLVFAVHAAPKNPFAALKVEQNAAEFAQEAVTLGDDYSLAYLNFFNFITEGMKNPADSAEKIFKSFMHCIEYLGDKEAVLAMHKKFATAAESMIETYKSNIESKIALKKDLSEEEKENIGKKLDEKIQELLIYINTIYYQELYNSLASRHKSLVYMFDENGIIPAEKRTTALPRSL
jgi:hypothetical protein